MGMIRKTASLATLGLVNWRSKNEELARVENERDVISLKLAKNEAQREKLAERAKHAAERAERAELDLLHNERKATRRRRRERGVDRAARSAAEATRRARRKAKRHAKAAKKAARSTAENVVDAVDR